MKSAEASSFRNVVLRKARNVGYALMLGVLAAFALAQSAAARDTNLVGGPGGNFREMPCPDGYFLIGLTASSGAWINRVSPMCRRWVIQAGAFDKYDYYTADPFAGTSDGGSPITQTCRGTDVMTGFFAEATRNGNQPQYINNIEMQCMNTPVVPHHFVSSDTPAIIWDGVGAIYQSGAYCNADEAPVGIIVRAGLYVDAIGMMCGAAPPAPTPTNVWHPNAAERNRIMGRDPGVLTPTPAAPLPSSDPDPSMLSDAERAWLRKHHPH